MTINKEDLQAKAAEYLATLNDTSHDEAYGTARRMAAGFADDFLAWLYPEPKIALPVHFTALGLDGWFTVRDANNLVVARCSDFASADLLVKTLNGGAK